jgi:hypothetical protein
MAVTRRATRETMALHDALKSLSLRRAHNLHPVPRLKELHRELLARLEGFVAPDPEFAENAGRVIQPDTCGVTELRASAPLILLAAESKLHSGISVPVGFLDLHHRARSGLDDRDRNGRPFVVEEPGHPEFTSNKSRHRSDLSQVSQKPFCLSPP